MTLVPSGWLRKPPASSRASRSTNALQLVHLYAEKESPKYEKAALRWLGRYLAEGEPTLELFARAVRRLAELERGVSGSGSARC